MVLKQSAMGHTVSMINDASGSPATRAESTVGSDACTVVRIYLDIHRVHGSNVSQQKMQEVSIPLYIPL